ncbi:MAG: Na+/H+ antiporter NhaC family protein [Negativibacillus sp.]|nr:Na+/H+ antiporter NhaC family protein [Negativibacillus sp.]
MDKKASGKALLPFGIFVGVYLATGMILNFQGVEMAFYQLPAPVAAILGVLVAFVMFSGKMDEKLGTFLTGCGSEGIMTMCMIYLFAGAFATVSNAMGGVDSVVNLGMSVMPPQFIAAGAFVISAFIALATGTSVGTVTAMTPITIGLAEAGGINTFLVVGATIGGAMFGDNLSMISDTTIAATRTQGVEMKDKFKTNFFIALPAAILTIALLLIFGRPETVPTVTRAEFSLLKVLPYLFVLITSLVGINVFVVLTGGILFSGLIGIFTGSFTVLEFTGSVYSGFSGMFEIFLLSMLMGGLATMVEKEGGIEWVLQKIKKIIKNQTTAELGIATMVSLTDMATANNTVSILINGSVAREISEEYQIDPKRTASLLDIFSCVWQGLLPYGAQILFACALIPNLDSPFQVISMCWYQYLLAAFAILSTLMASKRGGAKLPKQQVK